MTTLVGVLAEPPLAGECKRGLLAAHGPDWVAGFYAAMLRDVLDGAQALAAVDYVVFATSGLDALERQVPVPWRVVAQPDSDPLGRASPKGEVGSRIAHAFATLGERTVLFTGDAPSFDVGPLANALEEELPEGTLVVAPSESGDLCALVSSRFDPALVRDLPWGTPAVVETLRVRCRELGTALREVPAWYTVDEPSDVRRLLDELRKHPDRAPRTAQYLVTHA
jgi:glycosyltransferase A (GT-A) superfamily protein (DUF2064 family)